MPKLPSKRPPRIQIQNVRPQVDCGRHPVKATTGDRIAVTADIFKDGHDVLRAVVRYRPLGTRKWNERPLEPLGNDHWAGSFEVTQLGRWQFGIEAWVDRGSTLLDELQRKLDAEQVDLTGEIAEIEALLGPGTVEEWRDRALELAPKDRYGKASLEQPLEVDVERERARFGSWYELFPRSWGGFRGVAKVLPQLAELGFDVVYLPPVHPIGTTNRKGRNNALVAEPGDPGSPWAIGGPEGGHDSIHPELGTWKDFDAMVESGRAAGVEVALDLAIQCSPDHPWLTEHPEWFSRRPDGTLKYAENPPKRYQDIYNVNFDSEAWQALWEELRRVVFGWCKRGVRIFRVDNPHTKSVAFWEWLIAEVRDAYPDTVFLSEAFTRPAMMTTLAKVGFGQSYTYFTWKNSKAELIELVEQIRGWSAFYRPNFFTNTQDILHEYLQHGGPPAFAARLVLAGTLSPTYGIYSGFEHHESVPLREGSEEYLNSEKYELKSRKLDGPLLPLVRRLNEIRRAEPALQRFENVRFIETHNEQLLGYAKGRELFVVVNLNPFEPREGIAVATPETGLPPEFRVTDLLSGERYRWRLGRNYVGLPPGGAHVLKVEA
ncbi:MAG TPA: alpha-1,4-glucan--maltose-1-phosphate maltosyltransferase [Gaiellaceae bacterium]|nr:alpha-1,4-glucan--maltose-1-phosphate maltosyltransferase [Gaiellaceae bacterium]